MTTERVPEDLKGVSGTAVRTSFDHAKENALKEAFAGPIPMEAVKID